MPCSIRATWTATRCGSEYCGRWGSYSARILATPLVTLADGPAKISAIFMDYDGAEIDKQAQATIIQVAEDMEPLAAIT